MFRCLSFILCVLMSSAGSLDACGYRLSVLRDDPTGGVALVATVELAPLETTPEALFVDGDVLLLLGTADVVYADDAPDAVYDWCRDATQTATVALTFDVADPSHPVLLRRQTFEGRYVSARKVDPAPAPSV